MHLTIWITNNNLFKARFKNTVQVWLNFSDEGTYSTSKFCKLKCATDKEFKSPFENKI